MICFHKPMKWPIAFNDLSILADKSNHKKGVYIWGFSNDGNCDDVDKNKKFIWYYSGWADNLFKRISQHRFQFNLEATRAILMRPNSQLKFADYYSRIKYFNNNSTDSISNETKRRNSYKITTYQDEWLLYRGRKNWLNQHKINTNTPTDYYTVISELINSNHKLKNEIYSNIESFWKDFEEKFVFSFAIINLNALNSEIHDISNYTNIVESNNPAITDGNKIRLDYHKTLLGIAEYDLKKQLEELKIHTLGNRLGNGVKKIITSDYRPMYKYDLTNLTL
jgi:hypothetical protein